MSRVDTTATEIAGRTSVLHFWRHYVAAGALLLLGFVGLGAEAGGLLRELAPWSLIAGALLVVHALAVLFLGTRWWVTRDRVVQSAGVVSRHTQEFEITELCDVEVQQGPIARLLNVGSLRSGQGKRTVLSGIRNPASIAALIRERAREDRGD